MLPRLAPPHAGQIRFRITLSSDPASFVAGHDLAHPDSTLPWSIPLRRLVHPDFHMALLSQLRYDELVEDEVLGEVARMWPNRPVPRSAQSLYACREPFWLKFGTTKSSFDILATTGDGKLVAEPTTLHLPQHHARYACGIEMSGKHCSVNNSIPHTVTDDESGRVGHLLF